MNRDVAQLLLQVDASVALAQRNLKQLASQVDGDASRMDAALGRVDKAFTRMGNSAEASARVFIQGREAANSLIGSIDPLFAAQDRYNKKLEEAMTLQRQGVLTAQEFAKVQAGLKSQLDEQVHLYGGIATASGNARIGQMELMHVVRASVDQYAFGTSITKIFALQIAQLGQAASFMGDSFGKVGRFLASGWGVAIIAATSLIATLINKHQEATDSVDGLVQKMREQARQAAMNESANRVWEHSLDGLIAKSRELQKEEEKRLLTEREINSRTLADLQAKRDELSADRDSLARELESKKRLFAEQLKKEGRDPDEAVRTFLTTPSTVPIGARKTFEEIQKLTQQYNAATVAAGDFNDAIESREILIARDRALALADPIEAIRQKYAALARAAEEAARSNDKLKGSLATTLAGYKTAEQKEIDALREKNRKPGDNAVFDAQIGSFYDTANKYRGLRETGAGASVLEQFFREANIKLDPEKTAWCAAFVNAVLATNGVAGTGSLAASSFLTYGKDDIHSPQRGDIAVVKSKASDSGYHVGFVEGYNAKTGAVTVLGGNTGDKVASATYSKNNIVAIRRPPTPSESAAATEKLAEDTRRSNEQFQQRFDALNDQLLQAKTELVQGIEGQAEYAEKLVKAEQRRVDDQIDKEAADKKAAGLDAAQVDAQAKILHGLNEQIADQKLKNIEIRKQVKLLQEEDRQSEQATEFKKRDLEFADSIARTAKEHRDIQLQILDIVYEEKQLHLERLKKEAELNGEIEKAAEIQAEINRLPIDRAHEAVQVNKNTLDPLQSYFDGIPHTADQINESLKSIEAEGIQGLVNALSHAGEGWDAMRNIAISALQDIASQLIKLGIERMIFNLFGSAVLGGAGGGLGGGFPGGDAGALDALGAPGAFATGGFVSGPGSATSDSIPAMLSNGEYVMSADAVRKFGVGYLDMMNSGRVPHKKGGGLLGGIFGLAGLFATGAIKHLNPLAPLSPGLYFGSKVLKGDISPLALLSPGGALLSGLLKDKKAPNVPQASIPSVANSNTPMGDTYNIHVVAPNTGDPLKDRQTGIQFAAGIQAGLSQRRARGLI